MNAPSSRWRQIWLGALCAAGACLQLAAQTLVIYPSGVGSTQSGFGGSLGMFFTVNQSVSVSQVGYWDNGQDGVQQGGPISVALFTRSGLASGAIIAGTEIDFTATMGALTGPNYFASQFRAANLPAPVTLTPGDYAVVAWGFGSGADSFIGGNGTAAAFDTLGGALTFVTPGYYGSPGGSFPTNFEGGGTYLAGSFVAAIPEPASAAVIGGIVGLSVAVGCSRGRRRAVAALTAES